VNDLHHLTLEFESEHEVRETARHLIAICGVTGEIACRRISDGCWRLDVIAEHQLGEGLVQDLKGRVVSGTADGPTD
jgi:hypothetical protein